MPPVHACLLQVQAALISPSDDVQRTARRTTLVGATDGTLDPDLASGQKKLLLASLEPLLQEQPSVTWDPSSLPQGTPSIAAFVIAVRHDDNSIHLHLLACLQTPTPPVSSTCHITQPSPELLIPSQCLSSP